MALTMLPPEIKRMILQCIDNTDDLRNLRLVSKQWTGFAAEQLFRNVVLRNRDDSAEKLEGMMLCDDLAGLVRSISFNFEEDAPEMFVASRGCAAIRQIAARCTNLSGITIRFAATAQRDVAFRWEVVRTILESLHHDRNVARQLYGLGIAQMLFKDNEFCMGFRLEPAPATATPARYIFLPRWSEHDVIHATSLAAISALKKRLMLASISLSQPFPPPKPVLLLSSHKAPMARRGLGLGRREKAFAAMEQHHQFRVRYGGLLGPMNY